MDWPRLLEYRILASDFSKGDAQQISMGGNLRPGADPSQLSDNFLSNQEPFDPTLVFMNTNTGGPSR